MNTWIFSKNGKVTEPLELASAKKYVVENHDAYGWQSSYTQWLPVNSISEFSALLPERDASDKVPQKIVDEFLSKEQALHQHFNQFNQELDAGEVNARLFEQEIATYKQLTANLSDEVKSNIDEIEQQYHQLQKKLVDIKQTVQTSQKELKEVVKGFNEKVSEKSVIKTPVEAKLSPTLASGESQAVSNVKNLQTKDERSNTTTVKSAVKDVKVEEKLITKETKSTAVEAKAETQVEAETINTRPSKPVGAKVISTRSSQPMRPNVVSVSTTEKKSVSADAVAKDVQAVAPSATSKGTPANDHGQTGSNTSVAAKLSGETAEEQSGQVHNIQTKLESGVKSIFKSVFTKEEQVSKKSLFADLVDKEEQSNKVQQLTPKPEVEAEVAVELDIHDDEASKSPRRRRRR